MTKLHSEFQVWLDGASEPFFVNVDQRNYAAWEASDVFDDTRSFTRMRFLAWSAAKRAGKYTGTFAAFNEKDCVRADVSDAELAERERAEGEADDADPSERS